MSEGDDVVTEQVSRPISDRRNKWAFGIGTVGRDMVYTLVSMFLIVYLTEVVNLPDVQLAWVTGLLLAARLFDAVADIVMGSIVDNTHTRFGHYKPWIAGGAIASATITTLLFTNLHLTGPAFVGVFALLYLLWSLSWTANDIPYWSLLPALTLDQKQRESYGALAKIFATIGLFTVVVAIVPVTDALTKVLGDGVRAWTTFTLAVVVIMLVGQSVTLFGVREPNIVVESERTTLKELAGVVFHNDQLLWTAIAMVLFMTGYVTTTSFGLYFFKYVYRNEDMYPPFAAVLGVAQLVGYATFPVLSKRMRRRTLYTLATGLILAGYVVFFFSPMNMVPIGLAGLLLFVGQAWVTLLMLVFLTDTIEYGQWKLGRRNVAVTFALQPFINKVGGALATAVVSVTVIISGVNRAVTPDDVTPGGLLIVKIAMLIVPPILIIVGYLIYRAKYRIDEAMYASLVADLKKRGQLR